MTGAIRVPAPGFADPVRDAQRTFRAALDALARPTIPVDVDAGLEVPGALTPAAGALVLALCDDSTPVWLDAELRSDEDVVGWIAFHTGAPITDDPSAAAFAVVAGPATMPALDAFALGTDEAPHTSTTLIVGLRTDAHAVPFVADGPGFPEPTGWDAPVGEGFAEEWARNAASFPRGVDVVFAGEAQLVGLPRTTRLIRKAG